ncbi:MAG: OsmC family protein [Planctomycetes bacterium]|nr:OsmC family protein [Planctomycetota bacterium]
MSTQQTTSTINGVAVDRLFETVENLRQMPDLASFKFRQTNRWIHCGHNRSEIKNFYGAGEEQTDRKKPFVLDADEPPLLLGTDKGANPVEYLLHALTACVTTSIVYHAAAKGVRIEELESRTEGDIDLRGFLGIDDAIPRGYQDIRMKFKIKANVPEDRLEEIVRLGPAFSPVFDTVTRAVRVNVDLER